MTLKGKQIGALIGVVLGLILAFLPVQKRQIKLNAQELAKQIVNSEDRIDPQTVSKWIVEGNSEILLIDVRSSEEYQDGHIKSALNLPMVELLKRETIESLTPNKLLILYSNGISNASQAWVVLHAAGIKNVVVLEGGLNYWNKSILNPDQPGPYASNDEILIYKTKAAIASGLGGGELDVQKDEAPTVKPKAILNMNRKKKKTSGGC